MKRACISSVFDIDLSVLKTGFGRLLGGCGRSGNSLGSSGGGFTFGFVGLSRSTDGESLVGVTVSTTDDEDIGASLPGSSALVLDLCLGRCVGQQWSATHLAHGALHVARETDLCLLRHRLELTSEQKRQPVLLQLEMCIVWECWLGLRQGWLLQSKVSGCLMQKGDTSVQMLVWHALRRRLGRCLCHESSEYVETVELRRPVLT